MFRLGLLLIGTILIATSPAGGAPLQTTRVIPNRAVTVGLGWDPTWMMNLSYVHRLSVKPAVAADVSLTVPVVLATQGAWKLGMGTRTQFVLHEDWSVPLAAAALVLRSIDATGAKTGLGMEGRIQPGYHAGAGFIAADVGVRSSLATYISHSRMVKELFRGRYPDGDPGAGPRDGWYSSTSLLVHAGVAGGGRVSDRFAVWVRGGYLDMQQKQGIVNNPSIGQLPFYVTTGTEVRW